MRWHHRKMLDCGATLRSFASFYMHEGCVYVEHVRRAPVGTPACSSPCCRYRRAGPRAKFRIGQLSSRLSGPAGCGSGSPHALSPGCRFITLGLCLFHQLPQLQSNTSAFQKRKLLQPTVQTSIDPRMAASAARDTGASGSLNCVSSPSRCWQL